MSKKPLPASDLVQTSGRESQTALVRTSGRIELSEALKTYLEQSGLSFRAGKNTAEHRRVQLRQARDASVAAKVSMGYWLAEIKDAEGQEAFEAAATEAKLGRAAAYNAVDAFCLFVRLPDIEAVNALGQLEFSSALACKKWDDEELIDFTRGKQVRGLTLDRAIDMPVRQFEQITKAEESERIKKLQAKLATAEIRIETANAERDRIRSHLQHTLNVLQMPEFCVVAREEAAALTEQADIALTGLEALLHDNLLAPHDDVPEADRYCQMAAGTYYHALRAVHARTAYLLSQVEAEFGERVTQQPLFEHQLKPIEVDGFKRAREQIIGRLKTQASNREALRENSKEGRKGRRRTVKDEG